MPEAQFKLTGLRIDEGSFVGEGDNPTADIMLFKHHRDGDDMPQTKETTTEKRSIWEALKGLIPTKKARTFAQIAEQADFMEDLWMAKDRLFTSVFEIIEQAPPAEMTGLLQKTVAEFGDRITEITPGMEKARADELRGILDQMEAAVSISEKSAEDTSFDSSSFESALHRLEGMTIKGAKAPEPEPEPTTKEEPVGDQNTEVKTEKSAELVSLEKKLDQTLDLVQKQATLIESMKAEKAAAGLVEKAKGFDIKGVDTDVIVKALKGEDGAVEDLLGKVAAIAQKAHEVLTSEKGATGGEGAGSELHGHEALLVKAKEIRKHNPEMSANDAYIAAMDQNPELLT